MNGREAILGRIREALRLRARPPGEHLETPLSQGGAAAAPQPDGFRRWLPEVGDGWEDWRDLFARNSEGLKTVFKVVPTPEAARREVTRMARQEEWSRTATHRDPLLDSIVDDDELDLLYADGRQSTEELEKCEAGITTCECLVAQTGSVLVTSRSCGGRALSVLPPHHVVVATKDQLMPDLTAAFELLRQKYEGDYPSMMSFITGPSRTGDIERILVLGAHGPKQLTVLLIAD